MLMVNYVPLVVLIGKDEIKTLIWRFKKKENAQDIISKLLQREHTIIKMPLDITFWMVQMPLNVYTKCFKWKVKLIFRSRRGGSIWEITAIFQTTSGDEQLIVHSHSFYCCYLKVSPRVVYAVRIQ